MDARVGVDCWEEKKNSLAPAGNRNMPGWVKCNLVILKAYV